MRQHKGGRRCDSGVSTRHVNTQRRNVRRVPGLPQVGRPAAEGTHTGALTGKAIGANVLQMNAVRVSRDAQFGCFRYTAWYRTASTVTWRAADRPIRSPRPPHDDRLRRGQAARSPATNGVTAAISRYKQLARDAPPIRRAESDHSALPGVGRAQLLRLPLMDGGKRLVPALFGNLRGDGADSLSLGCGELYRHHARRRLQVLGPSALRIFRWN
jgi:hypothetical protein